MYLILLFALPFWHLLTYAAVVGPCVWTACVAQLCPNTTGATLGDCLCTNELGPIGVCLEGNCQGNTTGFASQYEGFSGCCSMYSLFRV
jgi:hypothetical protein